MSRDEREELAQVICTIDGPATIGGRELAQGILDAGYRKPRIITTTEELDGLALESVVKSAEGNVWECLVGGWFETASRSCHVASDLALPATVLYEPTA